MVQRVKPPVGIPTCHIKALILIPAALFPIRVPGNVHGKGVECGPSTWVPVTPVGDQDGVLGFWFCCVLDLCFYNHLDIEPVGGRSLAFSLFLSIFQVK